MVIHSDINEWFDLICFLVLCFDKDVSVYVFELGILTSRSRRITSIYFILFFCRYKRIFSFGTNGITTYDPDSLAVTNRWCYSDVATIKRTDKGTK